MAELTPRTTLILRNRQRKPGSQLREDAPHVDAIHDRGSGTAARDVVGIKARDSAGPHGVD